MRLALVHPKFDRSGGAERYCLELASGLAGRGHEVHVFARRAAGLPAAVRWHRLHALPLGRAAKTWTFHRAAARRVRPGDYDIVQGFGKSTCQTVHRTGGGVHRAFLERTGRAGRPGLYDRAVLAIEDRLFGSPLLRAVICPSAWVSREVVRHYPAVAARVRVIPNGVDTARFAPEGREGDRRALAGRLGLDAGAPLLLFVATNFALKGLDRAVDSLPAIPGAHLLVAGDDDPAAYRRRAEGLGAGARLHFLGAVPDPAPLYRAADVLVHPTRYDPFANVCLEALACGAPVVTSEANGAADLLRGGAAGRVVRGDEGPHALAAAVRELLAQGETVRGAARGTALENRQEDHLDRVLALYRQLCGGAAP